jgi:hypothetical protein
VGWLSTRGRLTTWTEAQVPSGALEHPSLPGTPLPRVSSTAPDGLEPVSFGFVGAGGFPVESSEVGISGREEPIQT